MKKVIIKSGDVFGRLTAISLQGSDKWGHQTCLFRCECGNEKVIVVSEVRRKGRRGVKSCGCLAKEATIKRLTTHGMRHSRLYSIWVGMKTRCFNKNHVWYTHYGGKGIRVCDRWLSFENFKDDMEKSYQAHIEQYGILNTTLDRVDGDKNYELENCRWATKTEQSNNAKSNIVIEFEGRKWSLKQWASELGIPYHRLWARYRHLNMKPPELFDVRDRRF